MHFNRYAVYFTPPPGPLADFGAAWLGWDPATGATVRQPGVCGLPAPLSVITATPRKYGLHATIKPPFALKEGHSLVGLRAAFSGFCDSCAPVTLERLEIARLGRFLALVPKGDQTALNSLAANAVAGLDQFRAAPSDVDLIHRRAAGLSPEHETLLKQWGYPYVMQAFRFHVTLSGKLPKAQVQGVQDALTPLLAPLIRTPFTIDALSLMGEDCQGMFHLIERLPLKGQPLSSGII